MMIVMLTGEAGVGKDTYAREHYPDYVPKAFARYLKHVARNIGWDGKKDERGRTLLQELGDVANKYNKLFLSSALEQNINIDIVLSDKSNFIITDLRYDHEVEYIKERFYNSDVKVIKLNRKYDSDLTEEQKQHPSEQGISEKYIDEEVWL